MRVTPLNYSNINPQLGPAVNRLIRMDPLRAGLSGSPVDSYVDANPLAQPHGAPGLAYGLAAMGHYDDRVSVLLPD